MPSQITVSIIVYWIILAFFFGYLFGHTWRRPKVYRMGDSSWIDIKEKPIPDDIKGFIATDGYEVSSEYKVKYNSKGQPVFGYDEKVITNWQALPEPPKKKSEIINFLKFGS